MSSGMVDLYTGAGRLADTTDDVGPRFILHGDGPYDPSDANAAYLDRLFYRGAEEDVLIAHPNGSIVQPPMFDDRAGRFLDNGPTVVNSRRYAQEAANMPLRTFGPKLSGDNTNYFPNNQSNIVEIYEDVILGHELPDASDRPGLVAGRNTGWSNQQPAAFNSNPSHNGSLGSRSNDGCSIM